MNDLDNLLQQASTEILQSNDLKSLDHYRVLYLGKKGKLTDFLKDLGRLPPEDRPVAGQKLNVIKQKIQELINQQSFILEQNEIAAKLASEKIDISLPGRMQPLGNSHPVTKTRDRIEVLFSQMGFEVKEG